MKKLVRGIEDNPILKEEQKIFLKEFTKSELRDIFRLTGDTALSAFYLEHRLSEDMDFFSSENIPFYIPEVFLKRLSFVEDIAHTKLFDRNIFTLKLRNNTFLKVEFTHYPFKNIDEPITVDNLLIDSFLDIVVNKLCAIVDRLEVKDYVDVYCAIKKGGLSFEDLINLAEKKCEIKGIRHTLKSRLLQVPDGIQDLPLKIEVTKNDIEVFFRELVKAFLFKEINIKGEASAPPLAVYLINEL